MKRFIEMRRHGVGKRPLETRTHTEPTTLILHPSGGAS